MGKSEEKKKEREEGRKGEARAAGDNRLAFNSLAFKLAFNDILRLINHARNELSERAR